MDAFGSWEDLDRGVATGGGGYIGIYTPKISQVNFLWGKNDVRTAIQQFYTPKILLYPQNKFLAMPLDPDPGLDPPLVCPSTSLIPETNKIVK